MTQPSGDVDELRRQVAEARAWAWSEFHQRFDHQWLATGSSATFVRPDWLLDTREPIEHEWWVTSVTDVPAGPEAVQLRATESEDQRDRARYTTDDSSGVPHDERIEQLATVDRLRAQVRTLAGANRRLRRQRQRLALRVAGLTGQSWEAVLESVGVPPSTPRDPGPSAAAPS